ncbi:group II intron reverse transcriptase/maturase, partial [Enterocloster clostridioformis]
MGTENRESCSQRDSAERKGYVRAHRSFNRIWKERDSAEPDILSKILNKENLNRAYKRVKANKGAPGVDGMTIEAALPWLRENNYELVERIRKGKYTPSPVRRVEIPKPEGGIRKLGIPTVIDRIIQQAMLQQLMPIYEPLFSKDSFGYRPGRGAKDAILRIKEYIEQGYTRAVVLDLSKYFDTLNHTILLNLLRKQVKDERVVQMVKRYLKSGVMENGVVTETKEGSPQGGNLSPLLANAYLNEFDWEFHRRGVPCIRYADDIVLLAKSERAAERLLESSTKYLEARLKLRVNREKSRTVSVFAIQNFKFLGFCFGKNGTGTYIRVHGTSWKKAKEKL